MSGRVTRASLYAALVVLYVLHNDLWLWNDSRRWHGLPAGLLYHLGFCIAVSAVLGLLVVFGWPPWKEMAPPPGGESGEGARR